MRELAVQLKLLATNDVAAERIVRRLWSELYEYTFGVDFSIVC